MGQVDLDDPNLLLSLQGGGLSLQPNLKKGGGAWQDLNF